MAYTGVLIAGVCCSQEIVREPVVRHAKQNASCGSDARQGSGKQTHQRSDIDEQSKHRYAGQPGANTYIGAWLAPRSCPTV